MNRTSIIILLLFVSLKSFSLKADTIIFLGFQSGIVASTIVGYEQEVKMLIKPNYNFYLTYHVNPEIYLKTGTGLFQNGFSTMHIYANKWGDSIGYFRTYSEFSYVTIPFEVNYNLGRNKLNIYINLGLSVDFLVKQLIYANLPSEHNGLEIESFREYNSDKYKTVNFSFLTGIGIEYKFKPRFVLYSDIKYVHGLNQILRNSNIYTFKHRAFVFNLGLRLGIG